MKKSTLAAGAAAVLAVLIAGAAIAQQTPARQVRADADNDGRVSRAEFVDSRIARLTAIDANRDGTISAEERQSGIDTRRNQRVSSRFETLDKDGNGSISRDEFTAAREEHGDRAGRGGRHGMGPRGHRGGGRGHGGGEGRHRGEARGPVLIADVQTRLTTQFDRIDTDHDGYVTAEERTAARQAMGVERGERRSGRMAHRGAAAQSPSTPASE